MTNSSRRFGVIIVRGWRIGATSHSIRRSHHAGVSATVIDRLFDREICTFRSEDLAGLPSDKRRELAVRLARDRAAELNRWARQEAAAA